MHAGLDEQAEAGFSLGLLETGRTAGVPFCVAGGVNTSCITAVQDSGAQVAVAGSVIYSAPDVAQAAKALRDTIG